MKVINTEDLVAILPLFELFAAGYTMQPPKYESLTYAMKG